MVAKTTLGSEGFVAVGTLIRHPAVEDAAQAEEVVGPVASFLSTGRKIGRELAQDRIFMNIPLVSNGEHRILREIEGFKIYDSSY